MFPALLTAVRVVRVNTSRSIRTSVPSILPSARALKPTSDVLCVEPNPRSVIVAPQLRSPKSSLPVERESYCH